MEENSKKTRVREMFDSIAPRYDLLNHLLSFGVDRLWRRRMVGVVAAGTPAAILDVAAGSGDVAVALARRLPAARITGIDLSGEMLAVGRALMSRPDLVMLDEPSLGLAPLLVKEIFDIILKINAEGKTVLLVEQNALAALSIAHYAYVLEVGRVVAEAPGQELLKDPKVKEAYLGG